VRPASGSDGLLQNASGRFRLSFSPAEFPLHCTRLRQQCDVLPFRLVTCTFRLYWLC
jgi:hypothetical protein